MKKKMISLFVIVVIVFAAFPVPNFSSSSVISDNEQDSILGSAKPGVCLLYGAFAAASIIAANPWAFAGSMIGAYNSGCFD